MAERAKTKAEIDADVAKTQAETERLKYDVLKAKADAQKAQTEAARAKKDLEDFEIDLRQKKRIETELLALDGYNWTYRFTSGFDDKSVKDCIDKLTFWRRVADKGEEKLNVEIVFNSPGGSVIAGMDLFDYIQEMRRDGHHFVTATRGYAASMGGILLQAGDERVMGAEAYVLIHQVSAGSFGKIGDIEDEVKFLNKMSDRILNIFASRAAEAGANGTATKPLTYKQFKSGWDRKDWWLDSAECLTGGVVDRIR